jgi:hypothetical protein
MGSDALFWCLKTATVYSYTLKKKKKKKKLKKKKELPPKLSLCAWNPLRETPLSGKQPCTPGLPCLNCDQLASGFSGSVSIR